MGGGGIVGSVGGLVGIESAEQKAASDASDAALKQSKITQQRMDELGAEMMDFNQGLLDDWEEMFGPLEQNLNDYYNELDPIKYATQNKQTLTENIDKQLGQFNETMAAQGLQTSGMKSQAMKEASFAKATGSAEIDVQAPEQVRQQQQQWLGSNQQSRTNAIAGMNQSYGAQMNAQFQTGSAITNQYNQQAAMYSQSAAGYTGLLGSIAGAGIGAYGMSQMGGS